MADLSTDNGRGSTVGAGKAGKIQVCTLQTEVCEGCQSQGKVKKILHNKWSHPPFCPDCGTQFFWNCGCSPQIQAHERAKIGQKTAKKT